MTDYPDWQTPQAHADSIAITGAPLIHNTGTLDAATFAFAAIPDTHATGTLAIKSISYELSLTAVNAAPGGVVSFVTVLMAWTDSASGLLLAQRKFKIAAGPPGVPHTAKIAGPVHANTVKITFGETSDSGALVTVQYTMLATSRPYARDVLRSTDPHGDGFSLAGAVPEYDVLCSTSPNVPGASTQSRLLAAYSGVIHITATTASGLADMQIEVDEANNGAPVLANYQGIFRGQSAPTGDLQATFMLPPVQCVINLVNQNAAAKVINAHVAIVEPAS